MCSVSDGEDNLLLNKFLILELSSGCIWTLNYVNKLLTALKSYFKVSKVVTVSPPYPWDLRPLKSSNRKKLLHSPEKGLVTLNICSQYSKYTINKVSILQLPNLLVRWLLYSAYISTQVSLAFICCEGNDLVCFWVLWISADQSLIWNFMVYSWNSNMSETVWMKRL